MENSKKISKISSIILADGRKVEIPNSVHYYFIEEKIDKSWTNYYIEQLPDIKVL